MRNKSAKQGSTMLGTTPKVIVETIRNKINGCLQTLRSVSQMSTSRAGKASATVKSSASDALDLSIRKKGLINKENGKFTTVDGGKESAKSLNYVFKSSLGLQRSMSTKNVGTDPRTATKQAFLYEPTLVSSKLIRAWQQQTKTKWYDLSPQSRSIMNIALKKEGLQGAVALFLENQADGEMAGPSDKPGSTESKRITRAMSGHSTPRHPY